MTDNKKEGKIRAGQGSNHTLFIKKIYSVLVRNLAFEMVLQKDNSFYVQLTPK